MALSIDEAKVEECLAVMAEGVPKREACAVSRIPIWTFYRWLKKGRANLKARETDGAELDDYGALALLVAEAEAQAVATAYKVLAKAASSEAKWAERFLDRRERALSNVRRRGEVPVSERVSVTGYTPAVRDTVATILLGAPLPQGDE